MSRTPIFHTCSILVLCLLTSFISSDCTRNELVAPPALPRSDLRLIGEWYTSREWGYPYPAPQLQIFGFQLTACQEWNKLAIRANTGALSYFNTGYIDSVVAISLDTIVLYQNLYPTGYGVMRIPYAFAGDTLVFYGEERYIRSRLNAVVAEPTPTMLHARIDGQVVDAADVWYSPSAFVSRTRTPTQAYYLLLESHFTDTKYLYIGLRDFTGEGVYELGGTSVPSSYGHLIWGVGDSTIQIITDSLHTGRCVITQYDTTTGRCSGTFEFRGRSWPMPTVTIEVTGGEWMDIRN